MNIELPIDLHVVYFCKFFKEMIMVFGTTDEPRLATVAYPDGHVTRYKLTLVDGDDFGDYICESALDRRFTISGSAGEHGSFGGAYKFLISDSGKLDYVEVFPPVNNLYESFKVYSAEEIKEE